MNAELPTEARRAVARGCTQGVHAPCTVLGYFQDLLLALGIPLSQRHLTTVCPKCRAIVRLVG